MAARTKKPKAKKKIPKATRIPVAAVIGRRLRSPTYRSFKLSKSIKHTQTTLPSSRKILTSAVRHLLQSKKIYLGLTTIYAIFTLLLVRGLTVGSNLTEAKVYMQDLLGGSKVETGVTLFGLLLGSGGADSDVASIYQTILLVIFSLAVIWGLRQTHAKVQIKIRDALYKGMFPLVPFLVVLFFVFLQFLPMIFGNALYGFVFGEGLAVTLLEQVLWGCFIFLLNLLTLYLVASSVFAAYIVTLPDVSPWQALRSARELVRFRRWAVIRKLLFLPFIILLVGAVIFVPLVLYATVLAQWVYLLASFLLLPIVHGYLYGLYRELLR